MIRGGLIVAAVILSTWAIGSAVTELKPTREECYDQGYLDGMNHAYNHSMAIRRGFTNERLREAGADTLPAYQPTPYDSVRPALQRVRDGSGCWREGEQ